MKKVRQAQVEAHSLKCLTSALPKPQDHEGQRKTEEMSQNGGDTKVMTPKLDVGYCIGSWKKKDTSGKTSKIQIKSLVSE